MDPSHASCRKKHCYNHFTSSTIMTAQTVATLTRATRTIAKFLRIEKICFKFSGNKSLPPFQLRKLEDFTLKSGEAKCNHTSETFD